MNRVFLYGTLCHRPLLARVLGPEAVPEPVPARLAGAAVHWAEGACYPVLSEATGAVAEGLVLQGLGEAALARLDYYEASHSHAPATAEVETAEGPVTARLYRPEGAAPGPAAPWALADWQPRWGDLLTRAAGEIMLGFPARPPAIAARRRRMILARAAAGQRAERPGPATLRKPTAAGDIVERCRIQPYANFFAVEEYEFRHRRFDGTMSEEMNRAAFLSGDAATVLPYDPARDAVLLIEQFRAGPYARGDSQCWSVEAIAGLVDPGESPEETVRREAVEEAGVTLGRLHEVYGYYPSPGAKAEFIYSYVGEADLHEGAGGLGGLAAEGEDIRAHVVPFSRAMALVDSGEIGNAPLILTLLWLARNRERLRSAG